MTHMRAKKAHRQESLVLDDRWGSEVRMGAQSFPLSLVGGVRGEGFSYGGGSCVGTVR